MKPVHWVPALVFLSLAAYAADLQQKDIEVYGQNIHYADTGSGPTIILLHGLWGGLNEWAPIIDPLSENHRIIVMDFIGFHGSEKTARGRADLSPGIRDQRRPAGHLL